MNRLVLFVWWLAGGSAAPAPRVIPPPVRPFYRITFYCSDARCTGWKTPHRTASGRWPQEGRTVAADPRLHPMGSWVTIPGVGRLRVEDTGGAIRGRRLDVYVTHHEDAVRRGVLLREVTWHTEQSASEPQNRRSR